MDEGVVEEIVKRLLREDLTTKEWTEVRRRYEAAKHIVVAIGDEEEELYAPGRRKAVPDNRPSRSVKPTVDRQPVSRGSLGAVLAEAQELPREEWPPEAVLAYFHDKYEKWCRAPYRDGAVKVQCAAVAKLVAEHGAEQALRGVDALFGPPLDWVSRKDLAFLTDESKWSRFVAPAIIELQRRRGKGEQSESKVKREVAFTVNRRK